MNLDILQRLIDNPKRYGMKHAVLYPNQIDAITKIVTSNSFTNIIEKPTGSGKSDIADAMSAFGNVTVLVHTHSLGIQYAKDYGFEFLPGRQAFECKLKEKVEKWKIQRLGVPTAHDCHFEKMHDCPVADSCPYLLAKRKALASRKLCVTYPYALLSAKVGERDGIVVADECHHVAEALLNNGEIEINEDTRIRYELPKFPFQDNGGFGEKGKGGIMNNPGKHMLNFWISESLETLNDNYYEYDMSSKNTAIAKLIKKLSKLREDISSGDWFLACSPTTGTHSEKSGKRCEVPGFIVKSLNPANSYGKLIQNKSKIVHMSATIGVPQMLAREIGLEDTDYDFFSYPHPTPVESRPIFDLGCERINQQAINKIPNLLEDQANRIAVFISTLPSDWRGIVLTTSNQKIRILREILGKNDKLASRILNSYTTMSVGERTQAFINDKRKGLIAIDTIQGWGHGLDLRGNYGRFVVIAGVPHANPMDAYVQARRARVGGQNYLYWLAYNAVMQADGRVKRGDKESDGSWQYNVSAIADGSATTDTAMRFYSGWFKDAILKY